MAIADGPSRTARVVWASGEVGERSISAAAEDWRRLYHFGADVGAAAWSHDGTMLAAAVGPQVWLVCPRRNGDAVARCLWIQEGVGTVAWSATSILASAGVDQIYCSTVPISAHDTGVTYKSITSDGRIRAIALPGQEHVISVHGNQVVQWELGGAGSDDPTFSAADPITAVGIRPGDRRLTLVGTQRGQLQVYDATGALGNKFQLPDEPKIKQLAWYAKGAHWLVATLDGLYAYWPADGGPAGPGGPGDHHHGQDRLAAGLCRHVAASGDRFAYALDDRIVTSDALRLSLPGPVADLHIDPSRGTLAAIDEDGHVLVHRPGREATMRRGEKPWTRLLGIDGSQPERLLVRDPDGGIRWTGHRGYRTYSQLPDGYSGAVPYDAKRIVVTYPDQGILLTGTGTGTGERSWVDARVSAVAVSTGRIAVATPYHVAGFDVLDRWPAGDGTINLTARSSPGGFEVTLPQGETLQLSGAALGTLSGARNSAQNRSQRVEDLSKAVFQAGQIGDLLWQAGLDLAIDRARGPDPNRAVRLRWNCPAGDLDADRFPWELLYPSAAPLGWFGEPPTTTVRVVTPDEEGRRRQQRTPSGGSPTMRVVRGTDKEFSAVEEAFDRFRRRTRRTNVRLDSAQPHAVGNLHQLAEVLADPADILQLWAHSGDEGVRLSRAGDVISTDELAGQIARTPPRLAVLVGCSSGALGRALVTRGVLAAVAMRVPVYDGTIQPLVEDVTAAVLAGTAVDLAFAGALRRYLLTGQPGAAAVPMLYLAGNFDGVLFPERLKRPRLRARI